MSISILQPCLIPDLYYIASLMKSDSIFIESNANWSRKGRSHRFQIRISDGLNWLTLPILSEDKKKTIQEVRIDHSDSTWIKKMLKTLECAYRNSIYYDHYDLELAADFQEISKMDLLIDAINYMNKRLWIYLDWQPESTKFVGSIEKLFKKESAIVYMEENGKNFQYPYKSPTSSLKEYPIYRQHFGEFIAPCCVLDLLFEIGNEAYKVLDSLPES